jgi:error-prone DNA polymerase
MLADAGAFSALQVGRRQALWQVSGWRRRLPLEGPWRQEPLPGLRPLKPIEQNLLDHHTAGFSAAQHPLAFVRARLQERGVTDSAALLSLDDGQQVYAAGLVITRQRPHTAQGTFFVTLEDEWGFVNVIVRSAVFERHERMLRQVRFMGCGGRVQSRDGVVHVLAHEFEDLGRSGLLTDVSEQGLPSSWELVSSRDFH